jgi:hypothetical protein
MNEIIPVNLFSAVHLVASNYSPEKYDLLSGCGPAYKESRFYHWQIRGGIMKRKVEMI